jgi:hypothetical protein
VQVVEVPVQPALPMRPMQPQTQVVVAVVHTAVAVLEGVAMAGLVSFMCDTKSFLNRAR